MCEWRVTVMTADAGPSRGASISTQQATASLRLLDPASAGARCFSSTWIVPKQPHHRDDPPCPYTPRCATAAARPSCWTEHRVPRSGARPLASGTSATTASPPRSGSPCTTMPAADRLAGSRPERRHQRSPSRTSQRKRNRSAQPSTSSATATGSRQRRHVAPTPNATEQPPLLAPLRPELPDLTVGAKVALRGGGW